MRFIAFAVTLCLAPLTAQAQCAGTDLRATLSLAEQERLEAAVDATHFPEGNHWIARRGEQQIHVIGTMHLDDPRWAGVLPQVTPAVENADLLLVEMTQEEEQKLQSAIRARPELMFITSGPTLPELMAEDDWTRLREAMQARGMPGFMVAKTQPWMLSVMLSIPTCIQAQTTARMGLDHRLLGLAEAADIPVQALEPYDTLFQLFGTDPIEEQARLLIASLAADEDAEDQFATTTAAYFGEDTAQAWEMGRLMAHRIIDLPTEEIDAIFAELEDLLLIRRNEAWMDVILAREETSIAVAVGALHLMGESGLLYQLEKAGFVLTRAPFAAPETD